jgi:DNA-binding phage protein
MRKARAFDAAKYRNNPKMIAKYLNHALVKGDGILIAASDWRYDTCSRRGRSLAEDRIATRKCLQII